MSVDPILLIQDVQADGETCHTSCADHEGNGCAETRFGDSDVNSVEVLGNQMVLEHVDSDPRLPRALALFEREFGM